MSQTNFIQIETDLKPAELLKMASPSEYPLPRPKPIPTHTGKALLLNSKTDAMAPAAKPIPVLTTVLDSTTSHLLSRMVADGVVIALVLAVF